MLRYIIRIALLSSVISFSACDRFLTIEDPFGEVGQEALFQNAATANSAVTSLYANLRSASLLSGSLSGLGVQLGYYTDELTTYVPAGNAGDLLSKHQVLASHAGIKSLWTNAYKTIYMCNTVLEGLAATPNLSQDVKNQLSGEVRFVRALVHFYLVNLFGNIPYIETSDYISNTIIGKTSVSDVYQRIIDDLTLVEESLPTSLTAGTRIRVNKFGVLALKARVYLYMQDWANAKLCSESVIQASHLYDLESLDGAFLKSSKEVILHFAPEIEGNAPAEGSIHILIYGPPLNFSLSKEAFETIDDLDQRKLKWFGRVEGAGQQSWYYLHKYKQRLVATSSSEYSVALRLAEQYLIRAEAKANLGDLPGGYADLEMTRKRAGLTALSVGDLAQFYRDLVEERRIELIGEHGHRWFDIRRLGLAESVLKPLKVNWRPENILFPIPESELLVNPNLNPQNPGY